VVLGFSKCLKSNFDFFVGEGAIVVSIKMLECSSGLMLSDAFLFFDESAETEVFEESVGEHVEFSLVNFTWGLGVNLLSGFLDPFPFISGDGVVLGFSKLLNSNLDFIVGEGPTVVGIKSFETFSGHILGDASTFSLGADSNGRGGGEESSNSEFHL